MNLSLQIQYPTTQITIHPYTHKIDPPYISRTTGPDVELMQEILAQVGKRHKDFGVQASYFAHMGTALVHGLAKILGPSFLEPHRKAWEEVYHELSAEIMQSME